MNFKIIAVDFDGTLCEDKWPEIGAVNTELMSYLKACRRNGDKIILWTCRVGNRLTEANWWCHSYQLYFDAINENLPEIIEEFGGDCRKIYADEYIDDKSSNRFTLPFVSHKIPHDGITDKILYDLEKLFEFRLYPWQVAYLKGDRSAFPTSGRGNGKTIAYCLRLLLGDGPTFDVYDRQEVSKLCDRIDGPRYAASYCSFMADLNDKLTAAGFKTNHRNKEKQVHYNPYLAEGSFRAMGDYEKGGKLQ